jgi:GNAT superfamily N-acetyltransferase
MSSENFGTIWVFELDKQSLPEREIPELLCKRIYYGEARLMQSTMDKIGRYLSLEAEMRFGRGREGYVGELQSETGKVGVVYGWLAFNKEGMGETGWAFEVPQGDVYLYDFATAPDYRGKGYYPELLKYILQDLVKRKYKQAWIATAPGNLASTKGIAKAGFQKVADTRYSPASGTKPSRFELVGAPDVKPELLAQAKKAHVRTKF